MSLDIPIRGISCYQIAGDSPTRGIPQTSLQSRVVIESRTICWGSFFFLLFSVSVEELRILFFAALSLQKL